VTEFVRNDTPREVMAMLEYAVGYRSNSSCEMRVCHRLAVNWENSLINAFSHENGVTRWRCPGPRSPGPTRRQGIAAVVRNRAARVTKYIEFQGGMGLPHVYLPARSLHTTEQRCGRLVAASRSAHGEEATTSGASSNRC